MSQWGIHGLPQTRSCLMGWRGMPVCSVCNERASGIQMADGSDFLDHGEVVMLMLYGGTLLTKETQVCSTLLPVMTARVGEVTM